jgi:hypothetical protein
LLEQCPARGSLGDSCSLSSCQCGSNGLSCKPADTWTTPQPDCHGCGGGGWVGGDKKRSVEYTCGLEI